MHICKQDTQGWCLTLSQGYRPSKDCYKVAWKKKKKTETKNQKQNQDLGANVPSEEPGTSELAQNWTSLQRRGPKFPTIFSDILSLGEERTRRNDCTFPTFWNSFPSTEVIYLKKIDANLQLESGINLLPLWKI